MKQLFGFIDRTASRHRLLEMLWNFTKSKFSFIRFLISGGIGAAINIGVLYVATDYFGLYYLVSVGFAFWISYCVGFMLQKFWTFGDHSKEKMHTQAGLYFLTAGINFFINEALMFAFVDGLGLNYIVAQILSSALIAVESFFVYRYVIFASADVRK